MIAGKKRIELTADNILKVISEFDIYHYYMGSNDWTMNEVTSSPFRADVHPSFLIGNKNGYISHIDFADSAKSGDCFAFVQQLFNIPTYNETLKKIDADFGLGISGDGNVGQYKKIVSAYKQPEENKEKHSTMIQVITRKFTQDELKYWADYHQNLQDLRDNHIYSIDKVFLNRKRFPIKENELRFGYLYQGQYWKLYFPTAPKKRKWLSNVPLNLAGGLENLSKEHNTLICKSLKDQLVCRKIYPYICHVQNESIGAFSYETVDYINNNSKIVFYGGDNDGPGKSASYIITDTFKWKHINPPDHLVNDCCKDFADWGRKDLKEVEEHFKKKGLILR